MYDLGWIGQSDGHLETYGDIGDYGEARRARFYTSGTIYGNTFFKLGVDFAGGDADLKDAYVGVNDLPYVHMVQAGHFNEPFSLEHLTSNNYITFMERSLPNALVPGRSAGVMIGGPECDQRMTWWLGAFRAVDDYGEAEDDTDYAVTGRVTCVPWMAGKDRLIHTGVNASWRTSPNDFARYRQRPEWHRGPRWVDTGTFHSNRQFLLGADAALVYGPFSAQAEWIGSFADVDHRTWPKIYADDRDDALFHGFAVQLSYWLTGEHRKYDAKKGCFGRVSPKRNFNPKDGGWGAWELAARYSLLDLNDANIEGWYMEDATVGINWHLNPNMRMMFNYIYADVENYRRHDIGSGNMFGIRLQVDF